MTGKKKQNSEDPAQLNFDDDEKPGLVPSKTPADERGDNEDAQYYEEEEVLSPEEVQVREDEDNL